MNAILGSLRRPLIGAALAAAFCIGWQVAAWATCPQNDDCPAPEPNCAMYTGQPFNCCSFHAPDCCEYTCTPCYYTSTSGGTCTQANGIKHTDRAVYPDYICTHFESPPNLCAID